MESGEKQTGKWEPKPTQLKGEWHGGVARAIADPVMGPRCDGDGFCAR
jgi:hypothetical protein